MSGEIVVTAGELLIKKDGRTVLDTAHRSAELVPAAKITLDGHVISYPDLWGGVVYFQTRRDSGPTFPNDFFACSSYVAIVPQEWGPSHTYNLADVVLGTVPAGCNYLDVRVNLTRTLAPAGLGVSQTIRTLIPEGQWIKLEGGSCLVEGYGAIRRLFEIKLDGTNVVLSRMQSVNNTAVISRFPGGCTLGNQTYYFAGTNAPADGGPASLGALLSAKGEDTANNHRPTICSPSQDPCAQSRGGVSYASTWTGSIHITPGIV